MKRVLCIGLMVFAALFALGCQPSDAGIQNIREQFVSGSTDKALQNIEAYLANNPKNVEGLVLKTDILETMGESVKALETLELALKETESLEILVHTGLLNQKIGRFEKAAEVFNHAADKFRSKIEATDMNAYVQMAEAEFGAENIDEASKIVEMLMNSPKHKAFALTMQGRILLKKQMYSEAAGYFQAALEYDYRSDRLYVYLGQTYGALYDAERSLEMYTRALIIEPSSPEALLGTAALYRDQGEYEAQIGNLQKYIIQAPYDLTAVEELLSAYLALGDYEKIIEIREKQLLQEPKSVAGFTGLLDAYYYLEDYDGVRRTIERMKPVLEAVDFYGLAASYYYYIDDNEEAISLYEEAIALFPEDNTLVSGLADVYNYMEDEEGFDQVFYAYQKKTSLAEMLAFRAEYYTGDEQYQKAIEDFVSLMMIEPTNRVTHLERIGDVLTYLEEEEALGLAEKVISKFPSDVNTSMLMGDYKSWRSDYLGAIEAYEKVLLTFAGSAEVYLEIARNYAFNGDEDKALEAIHQAIALNPQAEDWVIDDYDLSSIYEE